MRISPLLAAALTALPLVTSAQPAQPPMNAVTLYGGYRGGGGFTDSVTGDSIDVKESGAVSVAIDVPIDGMRQYQFFVSHQSSKFETGAQSSPAVAGLNGQSVSVTYFHVGGTNFFEGQVGRGAYLVGGLGVTLFSPGLNGYSEEWRPSMNIGLGYEWPLGRNLSLRAEVRGYLTLVNSSGGLFCSGGCVVSIKGDTFGQGEAMLGLSARF